MSDYIRSLRNLIGQRLIVLPEVRAIIPNAKGEVLLQRRTDMNLWGLPAGIVEPGESALEAIKREVAEETALNIVQAEPMALYSGPGQSVQYPNGDKIQCFSMAFLVSQWEGEPCADGVEGSELRFFPLSHLPENIVEVHLPTLEDYARYDGRFILH